MVKLQHRVRRDGGVTVGDTRYALDERGVVEVSDEHAEKMLQGRFWRALGPDEFLPWGDAPPAPPMVSGAAGRRPRTREELVGLADIAGVPMPDDKAPKAFDQRGRVIKPPEVKEPSADEQAATAAASAVNLAEAGPALAEAGPALDDPAPGHELEEAIVVSMDMTKAELAEVCNKLEIEIPKGATKAQIFGLIEAQQGD